MTDNYDLKLVFPDSTEAVQTNSQFLCTESQVFQQLIFKNSPKMEIEIFNASPSIVFDALQCLHTLGRSLRDVKRALLLREFGKNYKMKTLYKLCGAFIENNLTFKNVGEIHDLASHYKDSTIQYYCWEKLDKFWREIFCSSSFYKCSSATMLRCVSRPVYEDMDEYYLWNAVYTWGLNRIDHDKKRTHREVIMEFLPYIRFLVMRTEELETIYKTDILTEEECCALREAYGSNNISKLPPTLCQERTPRRHMFLYKYVSHTNYFYCPKHCLLRSVKAGDTFYAEFTAKRDCFLKGFLLPVRGFEEPLNGMLELTKVYNSKKCDSIDGAHKFKLSSHVIKFNPPIFIETECTTYINVVIMENNLYCLLEPYTNCNIFKTGKTVCEETEQWKSFYINDIVLYF